MAGTVLALMMGICASSSFLRDWTIGQLNASAGCWKGTQILLCLKTRRPTALLLNISLSKQLYYYLQINNITKHLLNSVSFKFQN